MTTSPILCMRLSTARCIAASLNSRCLASTAASSGQQRILQTRQWLETIVIGQKLCPFAAPVRRPPQLRLRASACESNDGIVRELTEEAAALRCGIDVPTATSAETALLILDMHVGGQTLSWRNLVSLSWRLQEEALVEQGHAEHLQIVLFHPAATHSTYADADAPADAGDYTIRAPYPTVQLLREADVLRAVRSYPDAEGIPARNRVRMRADGVEACERRLRSCAGESCSP